MKTFKIAFISILSCLTLILFQNCAGQGDLSGYIQEGDPNGSGTLGSNDPRAPGNPDDPVFEFVSFSSPVVVTEDRPIRLKAVVTGTSLTYRWVKDEVNPVGSNTDEVNIELANSSHEGVYTLFVTKNDETPARTISRSVRVTVSAQELNGGPLYTTNCQSCHGVLNQSSVKNMSLGDIQDALTNVPAMSNLNLDLSRRQLAAIESALDIAPPLGNGIQRLVFANDNLRLTKGQSVATRTRQLVMSENGNLELYTHLDGNNRRLIWTTVLSTQGRGHYAHYQTDGNLVVYDNQFVALFASNTANRGVSLEFQDNGNVVIWSANRPRIGRQILFQTRTQGIQ